MPEYRKRKGSDAWHWCKNCTNWPPLSQNPVVKHSKPTTGEFCNECKAKAKRGECRQ